MIKSWLATCQACTSDLYAIVQNWRRRGFRLLTLRSKLQAAFAVIIIVALGTAAVGTIGLVQRYQRQQAIDQFTDIALIAAVQMSVLTSATGVVVRHCQHHVVPLTALRRANSAAR